MFKLLGKIFIGPGTTDDEKIDRAYKQQISHLDEVWNDHKDSSYGIERILRLFLVIIQFIYPTLLLRNIFGNYGRYARKLVVEFYAVAKLLFPIFALASGLYKSSFIIAFNVYLLTETIFNISGLIFLSDIYSVTISYRRSILLLLLNYVGVTLGFSIVYSGFDLLNKALSPISAVYYSFVTTTTLGYGEYYPKNGIGQIVVISQLIVFILFVVLFINYFSSRLDH